MSGSSWGLMEGNDRHDFRAAGLEFLRQPIPVLRQNFADAVRKFGLFSTI